MSLSAGAIPFIDRIRARVQRWSRTVSSLASVCGVAGVTCEELCLLCLLALAIFILFSFAFELHTPYGDGGMEKRNTLLKGVHPFRYLPDWYLSEQEQLENNNTP